MLGFDGVEIGIGLVLVVAGLLAGLILGGNRTSRARIRALEAELARSNERLAGYRDQVEKHFSQTSDLVGALTRQYREVWDHLAQGARDLCAERAPAITRGFGTPLLVDGSDASDLAARESVEPSNEQSKEEPAA